MEFRIWNSCILIWFHDMVALRYLNTENQAWWIVFSYEMNLIMIKPWVFPDLRSWFVYLLADCFSFLFGLQDLTDIVDYPETVTKKYSYSHKWLLR